MQKEKNNFAYIDGANLHNGIESFGWFLEDKCSILLKRTNASITYLNDVRSFLEKEKAPDADETA